MVFITKQRALLAKAKECLVWFMQESAYQDFKIKKFKKMIVHVINFQRVYRGVKMRRIIRRSLIDKAWEKFVEE